MAHHIINNANRTPEEKDKPIIPLEWIKEKLNNNIEESK